MATFLKQNQQDQAVDKTNSPASSPFATSSGQSTTAGQAVGQGSPTAPASNAPSSSGRFTNIQNFIRNNQAQRLGQLVSEKTGAEKQKAKDVLNKESSAFQQIAGQSGTIAQGVQASKNAVSNAINALSAEGTLNPSEQASQTALQDLGTAINTTYQGPTQLGNIQNIASQAQNLQQLGQATQSEGGRMALLQRMFGRQSPGYTAGQTRLDSLLLGRQPEALGGIRQSAREFDRAFDTEERRAIRDAESRKTEIKDLVDTTKTQTGELFTNLESDIKADAAPMASQALDTLNSQVVDEFSKIFGGTNFTLEDAVNAGLVPSPEVYRRVASGTASMDDFAAFDPKRVSLLANVGKLVDKNIGFSGQPAAATISTPEELKALAQNLQAEKDKFAEEARSLSNKELASFSPELKAVFDKIDADLEKAGKRKRAHDAKFSSIYDSYDKNTNQAVFDASLKWAWDQKQKTLQELGALDQTGIDENEMLGLQASMTSIKPLMDAIIQQQALNRIRAKYGYKG